MSIVAAGWCPALLRRLRDVDAMRHDYPLLLGASDAGPATVRPLRAAVDALVADGGADRDCQSLRRELLAVERALRRRASADDRPSLHAQLAAVATQRVDGVDGGHLERGLARLGRLPDAPLVGCRADSVERVVEHLYRDQAAGRAAAVAAEVAALANGVRRILDADAAARPAAWEAAALRAAVSPVHVDDLDFDVMAAHLAAVRPRQVLADERRRDLADALRTLREQRLFPADGRTEASTLSRARRVDEALGAWDAARRGLAALLRAVRLAESALTGADSAPADEAAAPPRAALALLPPPLLVMEAERLDAGESVRLLDALAGDAPLKVVLTVAEVVPALDVPAGDAWRARLGSLAAGLGTAFVVQSTVAHLARMADAIADALAHDGPALLVFYTGGAAAALGLPRYLAAAAAAESRCVVPFVFDPATGETRLPEGGVSQADAVWPRSPFVYEDERVQLVREDLAFTAADFLAADRRLAAHFRAVPRADWKDLRPLAEWLALDEAARRAHSPCVVVVDGGDRLQRLVPDERVLAATRRAAHAWGAWRRRAAAGAASVPAAAAPSAAEPPADPLAASAPVPAASADGAPWIETRRCTSCNECIHTNARLFAYDDNRQAYIRDPSAGTYRQLVEAAERCAMALIHPGEPRDASEPDLDALRQRAAAFR